VGGSIMTFSRAVVRMLRDNDKRLHHAFNATLRRFFGHEQAFPHVLWRAVAGQTAYVMVV
jgi:hypothetical protein